MIGRPGGQHFWQLVAEEGGVMVPMPGSDGALKVENVDTGEVQGRQQQATKVGHDDKAVEPVREAQ